MPFGAFCWGHAALVAASPAGGAADGPCRQPALHPPHTLPLPSPRNKTTTHTMNRIVCRWVFWLSCAGALSADLDNYGRALGGSSKSRMQAAVAFSWLTW